MRGLKTAFFMAFGIGTAMILGAPLMMAMRPSPSAPQADIRKFAMMLGLYVIVLLILFVAIMVMAWRLLTLQREDIQREAAENMRELVEGSLSDHERKADEP